MIAMIGLLAPPLYASGGALPVLRQTQTPRSLRRLGRLLLVLLLATPFVMVFVPWTQTVRGSGRVVAYHPTLRQQNVDAQVSGRVLKWHVLEGSVVKKGDPLLELCDNDPNYFLRLRQQRDAYKDKLDRVRDKVDTYVKIAKMYEDSRDFGVSAAREMVKAAQNKLRDAEQEQIAAEAALQQEELDYKRKESLEREGLTSTLDLQKADRKYKEAKTKLQQAIAKIGIAKNELQAKEHDLDRYQREGQAKVDSAVAERQTALGDYATAQKDLASSEVSLSRQAMQIVTAPFDGKVIRLLGGQGQEYVKMGDPLVSIAPETESWAVELWMDGNDAPLIREGDMVRLQFEGWPAIQFSGWPAVQVGTFGGRVSVVDAAGIGDGKFRILVTEDPALGEDEHWPLDDKYSIGFLRQGVRAHGWVLLNQVTLGFEMWRRLNGFPPVVAATKSDDAVKIKKK